MANRVATLTDGGEGTKLATWASFTEADTGLKVDLARFPDRTVQVLGTFGGGTIRLEGSMDGTTYGALSDQEGVTIDITDATPRLIAQNTRFIRPRATAGAGMSVTVYVLGAPR